MWIISQPYNCDATVFCVCVAGAGDVVECGFRRQDDNSQAPPSLPHSSLFLWRWVLLNYVQIHNNCYLFHDHHFLLWWILFNEMYASVASLRQKSDKRFYYFFQNTPLCEFIYAGCFKSANLSRIEVEEYHYHPHQINLPLLVKYRLLNQYNLKRVSINDLVKYKNCHKEKWTFESPLPSLLFIINCLKGFSVAYLLDMMYSLTSFSTCTWTILFFHMLSLSLLHSFLPPPHPPVCLA